MPYMDSEGLRLIEITRVARECNLSSLRSLVILSFNVESEAYVRMGTTIV